MPNGRPRHARSNRVAVSRQVRVVVSFVTYVTVAALFFWPGQTDPDTLDEINEAATGHFSNFHTPLLSAIFRVPYLLGLTSPGWILVCSDVHPADRVLPRPAGPVRVSRRNGAGHAALHVATRALVGRARRAGHVVHRTPPRRVRVRRVDGEGWGPDSERRIWSWCSRVGRVVQFFLQIVLIPLFALFVLLAYRLLPSFMGPRRSCPLQPASSDAVLLYGIQVGAEKAINTKSANPQQSTLIYDLAQMSKSENKVLFPQDVPSRTRTRWQTLRRVVRDPV